MDDLPGQVPSSKAEKKPDPPELPPLRLVTAPAEGRRVREPDPAPPVQFAEATGLKLAPAIEAPVPANADEGSKPGADQPETELSVRQGADVRPCARCKVSWTERHMVPVSGKLYCRACADLEKIDERSKVELSGIKKGVLVFVGILAAMFILAILIQTGLIEIPFMETLALIAKFAGMVAAIGGFVWLVVELFRERVSLGIYALLSPLLNILFIAAAGPQILMSIRDDKMLPAAIMLAPIAINLIVIYHWQIVKKPFAVYLLGLAFLGGGIFSEPEPETIVLAAGEWIAVNGSAAVETTKDGRISTISPVAAGTFHFAGREAFTVEQLPYYCGGRYQRENDHLVLIHVEHIGTIPDLQETVFERVSSRNRDRLQKLLAKRPK